jgi:hypothetical protein
MTDVEIRKARADEVAEFYMGRETPYELMRVNGKVVAMVAIVRDPDGMRTWATLDVAKDTAPSMTLVRALMRGLKDRGGVIHVACNALQHPNAPKLLRVLGFRPTLEERANMRVWEWQSSH